MPRPKALDFTAVFDHAGLGMVIADDAGRIIRINDAFAHLVGRSASELIGKTSREFTHPEDLALTQAQLHASAPSTTFEKRYLRPDGEVVWARIHLSPAFDDETGRYLIATAEDITEQKRTREELIETRRRVQSALIAGEIATYEWDVTCDRLWGDANFDRIFGVHRDVDGTAPLDRFVKAIHPDDRAHVMEAVMRTVNTGADYETEYRVLNEGVERWVRARGRLAPPDEHGVVRFHGVVLDITARKRAEHELQRRTRLYDTFLSGTDDLAYLIDREGRFIFANRAAIDATAGEDLHARVAGAGSGGHDHIARADITLTVRVYQEHGIALKYLWSRRDATFSTTELAQTRATLGLYYAYLARESLGNVHWH